MKTKTEHLIQLLLITPMTIGVLIDTARVCPKTAENSLRSMRETGLVGIVAEDGRPVYRAIAEVR